jgi:hypothetical protein
MDLFHFDTNGNRTMLETGGNNLFSFSGTTGMPTSTACSTTAATSPIRRAPPTREIPSPTARPA